MTDPRSASISDIPNRAGEVLARGVMQWNGLQTSSVQGKSGPYIRLCFTNS